MDYLTSVQLALHLGYKEVQDSQAFKGRYLIKDGKKWIHDIEALMQHLGISQYSDLENLGYDLRNYHSYKDFSNEMARQEMQSLYQDITHSEEEATYLSDGMWLHPDGTLEQR
ncbi:hypothetical protein KAM329D_37040 [Aeromonas caviae]|uniref:Uncharacterized protein n=1 Tax=Aeromonas caviae TaxID=648 RepID=A0A7I8HY09_AERCA|nr:hypothetical protein [Aeromonas caviae]KOG94495.1 hypothetical protein AL345_09625 [Aeromonas caviae]MEB5776399.1 hypothetical protein [Aeromonas caviae]MEB6651627.1 hypothetical protein [Aeromonas caviae]QQA60069.1 hypothetical protein JC965_17925 [Aeromonas caviae]BCM75947.1 hypothetical protein KAM329_024960 [Aeromonas caviae]